LKDTGYGKDTTAHETISARLQASPDRKKEVDDLDELLPPTSERESPIPLFRRKSPERPRSFTTSGGGTGIGTINVGSPLRSVSVIPTQNYSKKKEEETRKKGEIDIWTTALDTKSTSPSKFSKGPEHNKSDDSRKRNQAADNSATTSELPADLASAVLEIQTVLRRDVERLRLDMVRQFMSFRSEMGQKWEGEVERLRRENKLLQQELDALRKGNDKKRDSLGRWKIC
jgi:hypothetical protein